MPFLTELDVRLNPEFDDIGATLLAPLIWKDDQYGLVEVPTGFYTDFASVPGWVLLPGIVPRIAGTGYAAVLHDFLYQNPMGYDRKAIDDIFKVALRDTRFPEWRAVVAYSGVRAGGGVPWNKYRGIEPQTPEIDPTDYI